MGLLSSPVVLGGIILISILVYSFYSSEVQRRRYVKLGAGPPKILHSNTFGNSTSPILKQFADFEKG
jgi:hypothetical protein